MSTFLSNQGTKSGVMQRIMSILATQDGRKGAILDQAKIFKHTLKVKGSISSKKLLGITFT
jgi:hypothetical protein